MGLLNPDARYLAFDPGDTWGWAAFDDKGEVIQWGQFHKDNAALALDELLTSMIVTVVVEDYRNYANKVQKKWSRNDTSKGIGKVEVLCELRGIQYVLQGAHVKSIGYKWSGLIAAPSNHSISHQYDAIAHGVYYLQSAGIRKAGLALPKEP